MKNNDRKNTMTLVEMLEIWAEKRPEKNAIIFHDKEINYGKFNEQVNRLSNFFIENGLKKGDKVGLIMPRMPELIVSFLATAKAHGVAVPINFELPAEYIREICKVTSLRFLIVNSNYLKHVMDSIPASLQVSIIVVGERLGDGKLLHWDGILEKGEVVNPSLDIKDSDVVYLNYTSGSTGSSKGAITTHKNIYYNTIAAVETFGLTYDDIHLCMFAPFAHPHELFARALYLGGTIVLVDRIYPKSLAEAISNHKVTCMMGLAPMYENLLELLEHKDYDLSSLRIPESGGMYTRMELMDRFKEKVGVSIMPVWGSTETTGIALANRPDRVLIPGSVGIPCPSYKVKVVDENGIELPPNEIGEMVFKGPAVVSGYYEDVQDKHRIFRDGWYYSGDLGKMDEDGNFYFVERKTGMMKVAGLKVYPMEIELVLQDYPDIKEAAVVSIKDRLRGEIPKAVIVSRNGNELAEKDVIRFCKERLSHYKIPKIIEIRDSLPKTGSGKIDKKLLQMECV